MLLLLSDKIWSRNSKYVRTAQGTSIIRPYFHSNCYLLSVAPSSYVPCRVSLNTLHEFEHEHEYIMKNSNYKGNCAARIGSRKNLSICLTLCFGNTVFDEHIKSYCRNFKTKQVWTRGPGGGGEGEERRSENLIWRTNRRNFFQISYYKNHHGDLSRTPMIRPIDFVIIGIL